MNAITEVTSPVEDRYVFFWGGPFSQWANSPFFIGGKRYNCAEQYMMEQKALLFNDEEMAQAIMMTDDPSKQKAMGRNVRNFDRAYWEQNAKLIVYRANLAKFTQNPRMLKALMLTGDKYIVEASPYDTIWGIGLAENDPDRFDPSKWKGTNWLGEVIMAVRTDLKGGLCVPTRVVEETGV